MRGGRGGGAGGRGGGGGGVWVGGAGGGRRGGGACAARGGRGLLRRTATRRAITVGAAGVGAAQQIRQPAVASLVGTRRRNRRCFGAARSRHAEVRRWQAGCTADASIARARRRRGARWRRGGACARRRPERLFLALYGGAS